MCRRPRESNLPPACSVVMITSSADFFGNFGCGSTGMPRPLSVTVRKPSALDLDLDEVGMAGERLVHGVVDHLGEQVVQRLLVGAADVHAGPPAHRLEPFQHLDVAWRCSRPRRRRCARAAWRTALARPGRCAERAGRTGRGRGAGAGFFAVLAIRVCLLLETNRAVPTMPRPWLDRDGVRRRSARSWPWRTPAG